MVDPPAGASRRSGSPQSGGRWARDAFRINYAMARPTGAQGFLSRVIARRGKAGNRFSGPPP